MASKIFETRRPGEIGDLLQLALAIIIVLVVMSILVGVLKTYAEMWSRTPIFAALIHVLGAAALAAFIRSRFRRHRKEKEQEKEQEKEHQELVLQLAEQAKMNIGALLADCFVIDSNIWMNEDYEIFFRFLGAVLTEKHTHLALYGPQFDEIENVKTKTHYGTDKNRNARLAIDRIERLQVAGLLQIKPLGVQPDKYAYADPLIVRLLSENAQKGRRCAFLSNDKSLRIRVRQHLSDYPLDQWAIATPEDLCPRWDLLCSVFV